MTKDNTPKFLSTKEKRYLFTPHEDDYFLKLWNNLENQLIASLMGDIKFKNGKNKVCKEFVLEFKDFKSDANLYNLQQLHCDEHPAYMYGEKYTRFDMALLVCVEKRSFLYVKQDGKELKRVLLERCDAIFVRNDIPHCSSENLTQKDNFRLHVFVDVVDWDLPKSKGMVTKKWRGV